MGKPLSALNLGDSGPPAQDDLARAQRLADATVDQLSEMEDDPRYHFCWGKLVDMRITITQTGRVSAGQLEAIQNIRAGAQRHEDGRAPGTGSRRYEGWDDRQR